MQVAKFELVWKTSMYDLYWVTHTVVIKTSYIMLVRKTVWNLSDMRSFIRMTNGSIFKGWMDQKSLFEITYLSRIILYTNEVQPMRTKSNSGRMGQFGFFGWMDGCYLSNADRFRTLLSETNPLNWLQLLRLAQDVQGIFIIF